MDTIIATLAALGYDPYVGMAYGAPSTTHCVITPLSTTIIEADDARLWETELIDIDLYIAGDYRAAVNAVVSALEAAGVAIDNKQYIAYSADQKLHNYAITASHSSCAG